MGSVPQSGDIRNSMTPFQDGGVVARREVHMDIIGQE